MAINDPFDNYEIDDKALALGATTFLRGISWTWAQGFPSEQAAREFVDFCNSKGLEHRRIYRDNARFDVRYR